MEEKHYKKNQLFLFLGLVILSCTILFSVLQINTSYVINDVINVNSTNANEDGSFDVSVQDYTGEIQDYFLTTHLHNTTLTIDAIEDENTIIVDSTTNCVLFDAVDIYNENSYFQGIIQSVTANSITFAPGLDRNYDLSDTVIKCGEWDMSTIDGATTPTMFYITPPNNVTWHIKSGVFNILDSKDMDDGLFGSRSSLENGLTVSVIDGYTKELCLIYNNAGWKLRKYTKEYEPKAPAGQFSLFAEIEYERKYGAVIELNGTTRDKYAVLIQDDMRSQDQMAYTIGGHVTTQ